MLLEEHKMVLEKKNTPVVAKTLHLMYATSSCLLFTASFVFYTTWSLEIQVINRLILESIVSILFFCLTAILFIDGSLVVRITKFDFFFTLFSGYVILITLCSPGTACVQPQLTDWILLLFAFVNFRIFRNWCPEKESWLWVSFFGSALCQLLYGLLQYCNFLPNLYTGYSLGGSFGNPGIYAGFLSLFVPFSIVFCVNYWKKADLMKSLAYGLMAVALLFLIGVSHSRAAWLGVLIGAITLTCFYYKPFALLTKYKILSVAVVPLLIVLFVYLYYMKADSADGRLLIWKISTNMLSENPIFGMGYGAFARNYNVFQMNYFSHFQNENEMLLAESMSHAFNEYLRILIETGVVGLSLFIVCLVVLVKSRVKSNSVGLRECALASVFSLLCFAFFSYPFENIPIMVSFFFLLSIVTASDENYLRTVRLPRIFRICLACLLFILTVFYGIFCFQKIEAYTGFSEALQIVKTNELKEVEVMLKKQYLTLRNDNDFLMTYAMCLFKNGKYKESLNVLQRLEDRIHTANISLLKGENYKALSCYEKAANEFSNASRIEPHRMAPVFQLAILYDEQNKKDEAIFWSSKILAMKVKKNSSNSIYYQSKAKLILKKYNG